MELENNGQGPVNGEGQSPESASDEVGKLESWLSEAKPEELAKYIRDLREENAKYRRRAREAERVVAEKAEQERKRAEEEAIKQGEWQRLAEERAARLQEVEKQVAQYAQFKERIESMLNKRMRRLPESVRERVPRFADPLETFEWLEANSDWLVQATPALTQTPVSGQKAPHNRLAVMNFVRSMF
jgi:murein L,D-transpeptidase YcbB/YkuD